MTEAGRNRDGGIYALLLEVPESFRVRVGALGTVWVPAGLLTYAGSARRSLASRVDRHLRRKKNAHWHIDYLTKHCRVRPHGAVLLPGAGISECDLNLFLTENLDAAPVVLGFGASDCVSGCVAHLQQPGFDLGLDVLAAIIARIHPDIRIAGRASRPQG